MQKNALKEIFLFKISVTGNKIAGENVRKGDMRGYINIPGTICCKACKICGARPVIKLAEDGLYVVKCPNNEGHYKTNAGLIDIDDWNKNNTSSFFINSEMGIQIPF